MWGNIAKKCNNIYTYKYVYIIFFYDRHHHHYRRRSHRNFPRKFRKMFYELILLFTTFHIYVCIHIYRISIYQYTERYVYISM